jgi:dipeptidyl-peptidase 4
LTRVAVLLLAAACRFSSGTCRRPLQHRLSEAADRGGDLCAWTADRASAGGTHLVAGRKHLTYLDGGELMDLDPGDGQGACAGEPRQAGRAFRSAGSRRTATIATATRWPATVGAGLDASALRLQRPALALRSAQRHGSADRLYGNGLGRRSQVFSQRRIVSFVRDHGLSVVRLKDPACPRRWWWPARPTRTTLNGEVDWVYEEELDVRSNYFWSPDSKNLPICR